jgi:hypothetical protein
MRDERVIIRRPIKKTTINIMKKLHLTVEWKVPSSLQGKKKVHFEFDILNPKQNWVHLKFT